MVIQKAFISRSSLKYTRCTYLIDTLVSAVFLIVSCTNLAIVGFFQKEEDETFEQMAKRHEFGQPIEQHSGPEGVSAGSAAC